MSTIRNFFLAAVVSSALALTAGCGGHRPDPQTAEMARALVDIAAEARTRPMDYFHLNSVRAESTRVQMEQASDEEQMQLRINYANELLYAGETEAAIRELTVLVQDAGTPQVDSNTKSLYKLLALAYLRLGEQMNCIENHTAQACILPIAGSGVHQDETGSRSAIEVYERILQHDWSDREALWLLNVAYMTVGGYPDAIPAGFRIDSIAPEPEALIQPFRNVAIGLGVDHDALAGGANVEDFNNDGFLDIFATSYGLDDQAKLFLSDGRGGFEDRTEEAGLAGIVSGLNTVHADYNNDGYEDILILRGAWLGEAGQHPNSLLRNNGEAESGQSHPTFTDVTEEAGLDARHPTQVAAWGDFNRDGWLDLFVGNESEVEMNFLTGEERGDAAPEHPSALYLNNGDGTFTDVAADVGLNRDAYVKGAAWGDVDGDGWPDLYVSVLGGENRLYVNESGTSMEDWTFEEQAEEAGVEEPHFSFPTWFWDYNHDGHDDIFVSGYDMRYLQRVAEVEAVEHLGQSLNPVVEHPRLYRNDGDGTFTDVTEEVGLDKVMFGMGANYGDLDNDGYLDFYVGTGAPDLASIVPNRMFHNRGGKRFDEVTFAGGFGHIQKGHGVGFGDFDRDGDQDIYAVIGGAVEGDNYRNALFENPGHGHNWITLDLVGRAANRSAVGARLKITAADSAGAEETFYHTVSAGGSFGASSLQQEIGLGDATRIDTLEVTWPNRERTTVTYTGLDVNQHLKIMEGAKEPEVVSAPAVSFRTHDGHEGHATVQ